MTVERQEALMDQVRKQNQFQSRLRTIIDALILAGVIAIVSMAWQQNATMAALQNQVTVLQASLVGLPGLTDRITKLETNQNELMRRQNIDDNHWEQVFRDFYPQRIPKK